MLLYKIVILGSGGVGFNGIYDPTIEDCFQKIVQVNDESYKLEILDTAGTEQFLSIKDDYIKKGDAFVIVYAINSKSSFDHIKPIIDQINIIKESDIAPVIIVGNKSDMEHQREIYPETGQTIAKISNSTFIETSAKLNLNVNEIFYDFLCQLAKKRRSTQSIASAANESNEYSSSHQDSTYSSAQFVPIQKISNYVKSEPIDNSANKGLGENIQEKCQIL